MRNDYCIVQCMLAMVKNKWEMLSVVEVQAGFVILGLSTDFQWKDVLQSQIYQERLVGLAVDEAHCVKIWSVKLNFFFLHYFVSCTYGEETFLRTSSQIEEVNSLLPEGVHTALTATTDTCITVDNLVWLLSHSLKNHK